MLTECFTRFVGINSSPFPPLLVCVEGLRKKMEESELGRDGTRRRGNAFPLPTQAHRVKRRTMQKRRRKKGDAFPFASRALRARTRRMCKRKKKYNVFPLPSSLFPIARELERCENEGGRKVARSHLPRVPTPQGVFFALTSPNG